jgi:hypothetical protein
MHLPSASGRLLGVGPQFYRLPCRCWPLNPQTATDGDGKESHRWLWQIIKAL